MLEKGIALEKNITGKATNINELILQISALNAIRSTAEPTEEEVRENLGKIDKAVADLNQHLREERINSLLAKERAEMWRDFVEHRTVKSVSVSLNRKTDRYIYRINDKARISYEELNDAYVLAEIKRRELAGELVDEEITIARDNKFNRYATLFFAEAYTHFLDHNLGKSACDSKAYNTVNRKGETVSVKVTSIKQLVADLDELVHYLLPEGFTNCDGQELHMLKKDVRTLGVALSNATAEELKAKGDKFGMNWLMNCIRNRINNQDVNAIVSDKNMDSVRTEPSTGKVGGITKMNKN